MRAAVAPSAGFNFSTFFRCSHIFLGGILIVQNFYLLLCMLLLAVGWDSLVHALACRGSTVQSLGATEVFDVKGFKVT